MKILITGSTAQQASPRTITRTPTFSGMMQRALHDVGVDVELAEPTNLPSDYLAEFDRVVVGIAPPTSLSANKVYPAFAIANRARKIGNLSLFIDAPEQYKLQASLKSVSLNVADLSKDFYERRKSYLHLVSDAEFRAEVHEFNEFLYSERWPTTYFPAFPWSSIDTIKKALPNTDNENLVPVQVDAYALRAPFVQLGMGPHGLQNYWTCDSPKTKWAKSVISTLNQDVVATKASRYEKDLLTTTRIRGSIGTIISLYRNNEPWWSPALAQSLSVGIPVITDWRLTSHLGTEWSHLASAVEEMTPQDRLNLALAQKDSYLNNISSWQETAENLLQTINLTKLSV